jgi:hypothetical protein
VDNERVQVVADEGSELGLGDGVAEYAPELAEGCGEALRGAGGDAAGVEGEHVGEVCGVTRVLRGW